MFVLCVLYSKDKRHSQDNQDKEVWTKYKTRTKQKKNSGRGEIFRIRPDRPLGRSSLLYNRYRLIPGGKNGRGVALTTHPI